MTELNSGKPMWTPEIKTVGIPRYIAIADAIARDIVAGRLAQGERLPPQRSLAQLLHMDFTTVARGYVEAQNRGLVRSTVGRGTFVTGAAAGTGAAKAPVSLARRPVPVDFSMNLPPEPDEPELIARMRAGLERVGQDLVPLLRYQGFGGSPDAKDAASSWLGRRGLVPSQERLFVVAGAHAALHAIFGAVAKPGEIILSEAITYPGARSLAAQLGIRLVGLPMDGEGIDPEALTEACATLRPKALYLNPTLQNPTTITVPVARRMAIADVARRFRLTIIEDDAYGFIPAHAPAWSCAAAARAATVMASPLTVALATHWIEDGTGDTILRFIRREAAARQAIAAEILAPESFQADPLSFNLWVQLPAPWTRAAFVGQMRAMGIGIVASDAFTVAGDPPEAVRVCLGGPTKRPDIRSALEFMAHALAESPALASSFL
jgi:DNA-binding transcriptional MocR family regulator